jgi:hypothetical protein
MKEVRSAIKIAMLIVGIILAVAVVVVALLAVLGWLTIAQISNSEPSTILLPYVGGDSAFRSTELLLLRHM